MTNRQRSILSFRRFLAVLLVVSPLIFLLAPAIARGQTNSWGERFWNLASETHLTDEGVCDSCGRPTLLGRKRCFHCLSRQAPHTFQEWSRDALGRSREALQRWRDQGLSEEVIKQLEAARDFFNEQQQQEQNPGSDQEREMRRQFFESLGQTPIGNGRTLNDLAGETVRQLLPGLENTDFAADPAKTLSYFLILDGKGFIERVKLIQGPLGQPLTLLEAYELYKQTDPEKARHILECLENVRKLSQPKDLQESLPLLLDTLARNLRLLQAPRK